MTLPVRDKEVPKEAETEVGSAEGGESFPSKGILLRVPEKGTRDRPCFLYPVYRKSKLAIIITRVSAVNENCYKPIPDDF